jgi:hypothetical protein
LEELRAPDQSEEYFGQLVDLSWGSRWPADIVWVVRKDREMAYRRRD